MKRILVLILLAGIAVSPSPAQDIDVRDTVLLESAEWMIWSLADTSFSVGIWAWSDGDITAASLAFRLNTIVPDWAEHTDSLIAIDTFCIDPGVNPEIQTFRRSVINSEYYDGTENTDFDLGYNGALIGLLNIYPIAPLFPAGELVKLGDLILKIRKPWMVPAQFEIEIDSAFYPPGGSFKFVDSITGSTHPELIRSTIQVHADWCCDNECGDVDRSYIVNLADVVFLINCVYLGGAMPSVIELADVNCDGRLNLLDAVIILNYLFRDGPIPCDLDGDDIPDCW